MTKKELSREKSRCPCVAEGGGREILTQISSIEGLTIRKKNRGWLLPPRKRTIEPDLQMVRQEREGKVLMTWRGCWRGEEKVPVAGENGGAKEHPLHGHVRKGEKSVGHAVGEKARPCTMGRSTLRGLNLL